MSERRAILVVDLAFGDCGKGTIVDYLARRTGAHTVVRFNGGPQAGHNVVTPDGRHHTFSQFSSGTFLPDVRTLLSRFMLIEPYALFNEAAHLAEIGLRDAFDRLTIDGRCLVITPAHQAANRLRELARGGAAHGTCGMGVGEAMRDLLDHPGLMIHAGEMDDRARVRKKLRAIRDLKVEDLRDAIAGLRRDPTAKFAAETLANPSWLDAAVDNYAELARRATVLDEAGVRKNLRSDRTLIFEGAQGVLLDESFGFHPHTTWGTTTFANAETVLDEAGYDGRRTRLGVLRSYFTRHGRGPLVTEEDALRPLLPEPHNSDSGWQGRFRAGVFDCVAARYALAAAGPVDALAVTHLDCLDRLPPVVCNAYRENIEREPSEGASAADCFVREAGLVTDLRLPRAGDLAQLDRITSALFRCRPIYEPRQGMGAEALLDVVSRELRTRVGVTSFGPTADDKQATIE